MTCPKLTKDLLTFFFIHHCRLVHQCLRSMHLLRPKSKNWFVSETRHDYETFFSIPPAQVSDIFGRTWFKASFMTFSNLNKPCLWKSEFTWHCQTIEGSSWREFFFVNGFGKVQFIPSVFYYEAKYAPLSKGPKLKIVMDLIAYQICAGLLPEDWSANWLQGDARHKWRNFLIREGIIVFREKPVNFAKSGSN